LAIVELSERLEIGRTKVKDIFRGVDEENSVGGGKLKTPVGKKAPAKERERMLQEIKRRERQGDSRTHWKLTV
jgi:hypothetical protein